MNLHRQSSTSLPAKAAKFRGHLARAILATSIAALLGQSVAEAQLTWNAAGPSNNWSTNAGDENWLPGNIVWTQNESAIFGTTAETIAVTTANIFNDLTFNISGFIISDGAGSLLLSDDLASTITVTTAGHTATINETIENNGGGVSALTKAGAGTLVLSGANTYTGTTTVNSGTLTFSNVANQSYGALDGAGIVRNLVGAGQLSFTQAASGTYTIGTLTNSTTTGATGAFTLNGGAGSSTTIATVNGASGSQVVFGGSATGSTTITNVLGQAGQTIKVTAGTVNLATARNTGANIEVAGGTLSTTGTTRLSMANNDAQTLVVSSGTLNVAPTADFGLRLGGDGGASQPGVGFTGTQTGGTINALGANGVTLGSTTASKTASFSQAGGDFNIGTSASARNLILGADTAGTSTTTYNLSGGKLVISGAISGSQGAGAKQAFVFTGGTLVAGTYTATNLTSTAGTAVVIGSTNTLTNAGGILAPGDVGIAGRTVITGNYSVTSPNALLAVDIGGTTQASAFQNGLYDFVNVNTGVATLGGRLNFGLINGYTPPDGTARFNVLNSTGTGAGLSGTFTNLVTATGGNSRVVGADGLTSFLVGINTTGSIATTGGLTNVAVRTVALGGYQGGNTYNAASGGTWDAAAAASWTNFDPGATATPATQASGAIAQFADGPLTGAGTNTLTLNSTRNIQGLQFSSTTAGHNYTVNNGGAGALILDNTGNATPSTIADSSASGNANALNVPITLNSNLTASVSDANTTLTVGGAISGSGKSLTKTGNGTLSLTGANNYTGPTVVTSGTLEVSGSLSGTINVQLNGGSLLLSGTSGTQINNDATVTLNGGKLGFAHAANQTETLGVLTLSATSTLDFGTGGGADKFLFSALPTRTAGTLTIDNWIGNQAGGTDGTDDRLVFLGDVNNPNSFANVFNQTDVSFTGFGTGYSAIAFGTASYEIVAVPEPSSTALIGAAALLGLVGCRERRRLMGRKHSQA